MARYEELGNDLEEYLTTMEGEEWQQVSDADCLTYLLKAIPERLEEINGTLKTKLLENEEESYEVRQANEKK